MAVNKLTGAVKLGDGHTALKDLEEQGGSSSGGGVAGIRAIQTTLTHATPALKDGIVLGRLAYGEKVVRVRVGVEEAWDGLYLGDPSPAGIKIGTTADDDCISGGYFSMENVDAAAVAPWTGMLTTQNVDVDYFSAATGYGPKAGIDLIATIDDGVGNDALATTGISHVLLLIEAGFV